METFSCCVSIIKCSHAKQCHSTGRCPGYYFRRTQQGVWGVRFASHVQPANDSSHCRYDGNGAVICFMQLIGRDNKGHENMVLNIPDSAYKLIEIPDVEPPPPPPPPAPPPPPPPATRSIVFTPPQIVQDDQVNPDEVPPAAADLENVRIDVVASDGGEDLGIVQPPPSDGDRGIIQAPQYKENPDSIYMTVQIESSFPGGAPAWQRFLRKHLRYPQQAVGQGDRGVCNGTIYCRQGWHCNQCGGDQWSGRIARRSSACNQEKW